MAEPVASDTPARFQRGPGFPGGLALLWVICLTGATAWSLFPEVRVPKTGAAFHADPDSGSPLPTLQYLVRTSVVFAAVVWPMFLLRRGAWRPAPPKSRPVSAAPSVTARISPGPLTTGGAASAAAPLSDDLDEPDLLPAADGRPPGTGDAAPLPLEPASAEPRGIIHSVGGISTAGQAEAAREAGLPAPPAPPATGASPSTGDSPSTGATAAPVAGADAAPPATTPSPAPVGIVPIDKETPEQRKVRQAGALRNLAAPGSPEAAGVSVAAIRELALGPMRGAAATGPADPEARHVGGGRALMQAVVLAIAALPFYVASVWLSDVEPALLPQAAVLPLSLAVLHVGYASFTRGWSLAAVDGAYVGVLAIVVLGWPAFETWSAEFGVLKLVDPATVALQPLRAADRTAALGVPEVWTTGLSAEVLTQPAVLAVTWPAVLGLGLLILSPLTGRRTD